MSFKKNLTDPVKIAVDNQTLPQTQDRADNTKQLPVSNPPIAVTLYTIDSTILKYLKERVRPVVTQNGTAIQVPIVYGDSERWKNAQKDGVLRDSVGKIQLPMIMIRRSRMQKTSINSPVNKYLDRTFETGWDRRTPYDRFSVQNKISPTKQYIVTTAPDYYQITYKCIIWTEYMEQMNAVVENISFESDQYWGEFDNYKFRTSIKSFEPLTELPNNADRVVRTQFELTIYAYLLPESSLDRKGNRGSVAKVRSTIKKTVTFTETDTINDV